MQKTKLVIGIFLLAMLVLSACSGQPANDVMNDMDTDTGHSNNAEMEDKNDEMMENDSGHSEDAMDESMDNKDDNMADESSESAMEGPAWHSFEFVNVSTVETFALSQLKGKVVLVETMATWCSNCLKQQQQVKEFHSLLGARDDFLSVGISLEAEIDPNKLVGYINDRGFDWTYAIAPNEAQEGIVGSLGGQFLNPPATPMFVIDKDGGMHPLPLGKIKSAAELLAFVEPFL